MQSGVNDVSRLPQLQLGIRRVVDARPDPMVVGKVPGFYGAPFGKIEFAKEVVFSEKFNEHLETAVRAAGYEAVVLPRNRATTKMSLGSTVGILDVIIRDLTVEQFQEILPAFGMRVEARMLLEVTLVSPSTGEVIWDRIFRGTAARAHLIAPRAHWEDALNEAYAKCLRQLQEALSSSEVRSLLIVGTGHGDSTSREDTPLQGSTMNLEFMIKSDKMVYRVGDTIELHCSLKNTGASQITLRPIFYMDVRLFLGKKGQPLGLFDPHVLMHEKVTGREPITLSPGETHEFERGLSKGWYTLPDTPGKYSLYAVYENRLADYEGTKVWLGEAKSNTVDFELIP